MKLRITSETLYDRRIPIKLNSKLYKTTLRLAMLYDIEHWVVKKQHIHKMSIAKIRMLRQVSENTRKDRIQYKEIYLQI